MQADDLPMLKETAQIVASHIANNPLPAEKLPSFIRQVYETLSTLGTESTARRDVPQAAVAPTTQNPAVPINQSVHDDYIICLEDGRQLKMMKRHLMASYNMTPEEYRIKWGLPASYPMVAPNYAESRSYMAKKIGLGLHRSSKRHVEKPKVETREDISVRTFPEGWSGRARGRPRKQQAA